MVLGCENIKNFALCGISCGPNGSLVVTDNDRIEISNLSRQFLFREDNVGQPKSLAAGARMKLKNKDANVDSRQDFVGPSTQKLFPDKFWMQLDGVVNALDNIEARLYVDKQCVLFQKVGGSAYHGHWRQRGLLYWQRRRTQTAVRLMKQQFRCAPPQLPGTSLTTALSGLCAV